MNPQIIIIIGTLLVFTLFGFMMSLSIKRYDAKMAAQKKKKGRSKYMREFKNPGK